MSDINRDVVRVLSSASQGSVIVNMLDPEWEEEGFDFALGTIFPYRP